MSLMRNESDAIEIARKNAFLKVFRSTRAVEQTALVICKNSIKTLQQLIKHRFNHRIWRPIVQIILSPPPPTGVEVNTI